MIFFCTVSTMRGHHIFFSLLEFYTCSELASTADLTHVAKEYIPFCKAIW
jgi:hypothetical protein